MPYPNVQLAQSLGFEYNVLQSYLAQLYLRKSLNQIHSMLYNPEKPERTATEEGAPPGHLIDYIQNSLDMRFVPPGFKFKQTDPPAQDILAARLRAKYWGAQVITHRPFIRQIVENNHKILAGEAGPSRLIPEYPDDIVENAIRGMRALVESTRAFHRIGDRRFIITNVFGTAHAQWGNLLTLAAVFRDPSLGSYVDERTLKELFSRTIAFFKIIAQPSSALTVDMHILEGLERLLWPDGAADVHMNSSFSSSAGSGPPNLPPTTPVTGLSDPPGPPFPPGPH